MRRTKPRRATRSSRSSTTWPGTASRLRRVCSAPWPPEMLGRASHGWANHDWWPGRLNLKILAGNPVEANPLGGDFDYGQAFETLDLGAVQADINAVLTNSRD